MLLSWGESATVLVCWLIRFLMLTLGYSCTWEWGLASGVFSLTNGGTAGAIWMFLITCFCMFFVMLSMAEVGGIGPCRLMFPG